MSLTQTEELEKLLTKLYFLTWDEVEGVRVRCKGASPEGLQQIIDVLTDALKQQDEMVKKMIETDPDFPKKMNAFLKKEIHDVGEKHEKQEQASSEEHFKSFG